MLLHRLAIDLGMTLAQVEAMPAEDMVRWQAYYKVRHEIETDTMPPLEFDDPVEQARALDAMFRKK